MKNNRRQFLQGAGAALLAPFLTRLELHFRDVFLLEKENHDPLAVLKTASYSTKYSPHNFEYYRMDSAVQTALAPHPLVVDIYSSCSLACEYQRLIVFRHFVFVNLTFFNQSVVAEAMSRGDVNVVSIP